MCINTYIINKTDSYNKIKYVLIRTIFGGSMERLGIKIEENLLNELKEYCSDGQMSEFIRQSITEKLNRKKISMDETYHWIKKLDKLDTESVRKAVIDIEFTAQVIYEEIKKQNEILKLILRRATFGCVFSAELLDKADSKMKKIRLDDSIAQVKSEIDEIKI